MVLLSHKLHQVVLNFCQTFNEESPLFKLGREKKVTHLHVKSYVCSLEHLFRENAKDILGAHQKYAHDPVLSNFFYQKWMEEKGHDRWAKNDFDKMNKDSAEKDIFILKEIKNFTNFLNQTMLTNAHSYLAYMYFAEYMTTVLGPIWMKLLDYNLNLKDQDITALSHHIELDGDHASEVARFMDTLDLSEDEQKNVINFCHTLGQQYNNFFTALAEINEYQLTRPELTSRLPTQA